MLYLVISDILLKMTLKFSIIKKVVYDVNEQKKLNISHSTMIYIVNNVNQVIVIYDKQFTFFCNSMLLVFHYSAY